MCIYILGEIISGSEEEDDDEEETNEEDAEAYMQEQQAKLEEEKMAIMNNHNMLQSVSKGNHSGRAKFLEDKLAEVLKLYCYEML